MRGLLQWHSRLARRTYKQYGRLPSWCSHTETCEGREFEPPLEQLTTFLYFFLSVVFFFINFFFSKDKIYEIALKRVFIEETLIFIKASNETGIKKIYLTLQYSSHNLKQTSNKLR